MKIADRIQAKRDRLVAIKDELVELRGLLEDETYHLSDEEQDRIEILTDEEVSVVKAIESLEKLEQGIATKATPVKAQAMAARGIAPGAPAKKERGGSLLAKHITAGLFAHKFERPVMEVYDELYGKDDAVLATKGFYNQRVKSGTAAADTATAGWAAELVQQDVEGFLEELAPISVYAALRNRGRGLTFAGMGNLTIPRRDYSNPRDMAGAFVGEGGVIPVKQGAVGSTTVEPYKLAVIGVWTNELEARAVPQIEAMVRDMILEDTAEALDLALLDNSAAVTRVRPAGLLNGVTATNSQGATGADIIADLKALMGVMQSLRGAQPVLIMNPIRLLGLSTITTSAGGFLFRDDVAAGRLLGVPFITADHLPTDEVYIVDARSFVGANDAPQFRISEEAVLSMANADDTAPTQAEGTAGAIGTEEQVPPAGGIHVGEDLSQTFAANAQFRSLYQTYQTAIRMVLPTGWAMTRAGAVGAIDQVAW